MSEALSIRDLKRSFVQGGETIQVLRGVDLEIGKGEIVALLGPSGSGKSTLLQAAGLLEGGWTGMLSIDGRSAVGLDDRGRTALRRECLGFVYQFHHLLPDFTALENVVLPQLVRGADAAAARTRAAELLASLGLAGRCTHRPSQLSGGEQQRVAVARALANRPVLVLADEPTGNLDPASAEAVLGLLGDFHREGGTVLLATHHAQAAAAAQRKLQLVEGRLECGSVDGGSSA